MEYRALTIGLTDELISGIQAVLTSSNLRLTPSLTVRDAGHGCMIKAPLALESVGKNPTDRGKNGDKTQCADG